MKLIILKVTYRYALIAIMIWNKVANHSYLSILLDLLPVYVIYQYQSIYHTFSTLPLRVPPSGFYLKVQTIAACDQEFQLIYGINRKIECMPINTKTTGCYYLYHTMETGLVQRCGQHCFIYSMKLMRLQLRLQKILLLK